MYVNVSVRVCRVAEPHQPYTEAAAAEQAGPAALQGAAQDEGHRNGAGLGCHESRSRRAARRHEAERSSAGLRQQTQCFLSVCLCWCDVPVRCGSVPFRHVYLPAPPLPGCLSVHVSDCMKAMSCSQHAVVCWTCGGAPEPYSCMQPWGLSCMCTDHFLLGNYRDPLTVQDAPQGAGICCALTACHAYCRTRL